MSDVVLTLLTGVVASAVAADIIQVRFQGVDSDNLVGNEIMIGIID